MYTHEIDRMSDGNYRLRIFLGSSNRIHYEAIRTRPESLNQLLINWLYGRYETGRNRMKRPLENVAMATMTYGKHYLLNKER